MQQILELAQNFLQTANKPLIVLVGPTASGKTHVSISLATKLTQSVEVINSDSRQLYAKLNIGTAKITAEEKKGVVHHLLDCKDPKEDISVGWYKKQAIHCIDDCHKRGVVPMMVGGSMLYTSAITDNLDFPSVQDSGIRKTLQVEFTTKGNEVMHKELEVLDPEAAKVIHVNNTQHLMRALEFSRKEGVSKTDFLRNAKKPSPYDMLFLGTHVERAVLVGRIEQRLTEMLKKGWPEEVKALLEAGYAALDPGMQTMGYKEVINFINGKCDYQEAYEVIAKKTRAYAKRQVTWWKRDDRIHWIDSLRLKT